MDAKMEADLANGLEELMQLHERNSTEGTVAIPDIAPLIRATRWRRYDIVRS